MKNTTRVMMVGIFGACAAVWGQGSLTPLGAPAPSMKTLGQVQPRIPISNLPVTISQAGSYYLTRNLTGVAGTNGITISASDVTIDLNGFALIGVPGSQEGVWVSGQQHFITISNGVVRSWGWNGVNTIRAPDSMLVGLRVFTNGWGGPFYNGLKIGKSSLVKECVIWANRCDGIITDKGCVVSECTSRDNGDDGIVVDEGSTVSECTTRRNGDVGIYAYAGSTISRCTSCDNQGDGIFASYGSTIKGCTAYANSGDGIEVGSYCRVLGNTCHFDGFFADGAGIRVASSDNRIEGNNVTGSDRGIDVDASGNLIVCNSARENTNEYDIVSGNAVGPITNTPVGAGPWDNFDL